MNQVLLEQTVCCNSCDIKFTVHADGTAQITGARRVHVTRPPDQMSYDVQKLNDKSSIAVIVSSNGEHMEAHMIRSNGPWIQDGPSLTAAFFPLSDKVIILRARIEDQTIGPIAVPIAEPTQQAA